MDQDKFQPGEIVYYGGHGLSIVVGRKSASNSDQTQSQLLEIRTARNLRVPIHILESRIGSTSVRRLSTKNNITEALGIFGQPQVGNAPPLASYSDREAAKILSSTAPSDLVNAVKIAIGDGKNLKGNFSHFAAAKRNFVFKVIELLADELSIISGLSHREAREHIGSLASSKKSADVWPAQANEQYIGMLDERTFKDIFGLSLQQGENLEENPPSIKHTQRLEIDSLVRKVSKNKQDVVNPAEQEAIPDPKAPSEELKETGQDVRIQDIPDILSVLPSRGPTRGAFFLIKDELDDETLKAFTLVFLSQRELRETIESYSAKAGLPEEALRDILKVATLTFAEKAATAGYAYYITQEMRSLYPDVEKYAAEKRQRAKRVRKGEADKNEAQEESADHIDNADITDLGVDHDENGLIERIRIHGFDEESLKALGSCYEKRDDLHAALRFYGAALDLSENGALDHRTLQKLHAIQERLGYVYDTDIHFSELEMHLQERMNTPEDDILDMPAIGYNPVSNTESSGLERENHKANTSLPHVTYAIPAEALKPGQRLKMTFTSSASGALEVTMEVQISGDGKPDLEDTKAIRTPKSKMNGHDTKNGGFIDVAFERSADGSHLEVSTSGHHLSDLVDFTIAEDDPEPRI